MPYFWYFFVAVVTPLLALVCWLLFCIWATKTDAAQAPSIIREAGRNFPFRRGTPNNNGTRFFNGIGDASRVAQRGSPDVDAPARPSAD